MFVGRTFLTPEHALEYVRQNTTAAVDGKFRTNGIATASAGSMVIDGWKDVLSHGAARRRTLQGVRNILIEAWRSRALEREQVVDLLRIIDQAFDRLGSASKRMRIP